MVYTEPERDEMLFAKSFITKLRARDLMIDHPNFAYARDPTLLRPF